MTARRCCLIHCWLAPHTERAASSYRLNYRLDYAAMASQHSQGSAPDEEDEWLIVCRCEKAKSVYTLLSCLRNIGTLSGGSNDTNNSSSMTQSSSRRQQNASSTMQPVTVFCYPNSLSFHVLGKSKQIQASVNLQASLFSEYNLAQQDSNEKKTEDWHSEGEVGFMTLRMFAK